jgi:hypothetical protein
MPAPLGGFVIAADDHACFHWRVVEQVGSQPKHAIRQVSVHQFPVILIMVLVHPQISRITQKKH